MILAYSGVGIDMAWLDNGGLHMTSRTILIFCWLKQPCCWYLLVSHLFGTRYPPFGWCQTIPKISSQLGFIKYFALLQSSKQQTVRTSHDIPKQLVNLIILSFCCLYIHFLLVKKSSLITMHSKFLHLCGSMLINDGSKSGIPMDIIRWLMLKMLKMHLKSLVPQVFHFDPHNFYVIQVIQDVETPTLYGLTKFRRDLNCSCPASARAAAAKPRQAATPVHRWWVRW